MMQFPVGFQHEENGVTYRVVSGHRCLGDKIIQFKLPGSDWHTPTIEHSLILISCKYEVEENNYGTEGKITKGKGGKKLLAAISDACRRGWKVAVTAIKNEAVYASRQRSMFAPSDQKADWEEMWQKPFERPELVWGKDESKS